ncbi:hypothetical protein [Shewanella violacea]|uniref:Uncharacterized protein n=1 Tax=Shewanella violacea (strain JCM 10179 / CIP 106290 / LMG 19151 / DSS12) TaxID=637905 RepID=D4ZD46_SHEVD|nr:hypothetical protein [Shewanella violacea]BAJ03941.1 conserved hypothetical protein [Shewanella violacea DSS12]
MNEFSSFFLQSYWWLSLLGGLHCFGLGLYIRYLYREGNGNHKLLGSIFSLIALYFFTGMLNKDNAPAPIHLLFMLIIPVYFLLMPLLYLYCYRSLHNIRRSISFSRHFYLALIVAIVVITASLLSKNVTPDLSIIELSYESNMSLINKLGALLPGLLSMQTCIYFILIIRMLQKYRGRSYKAHQESLRDIKFRWLLVLTFAMMVNWLIRTVLVILPFYLGDQISQLTQAFTQLTLLLTIYVLAIYGLQQITRAAYLRGRLTITTPSGASRNKASTQLLNSEELNYLQDLLKEDPKTDEDSNKSHQVE